jgi:peptidoglycan/LPS O-acetylase OafA/YrhL
MVFFVLSGFVLTLPFLDRRSSWRAYYPARIVRLGVPAWASLVLAVLLVVTVYRDTGSTGSWWLDAHVGLDPWASLRDAALVAGVSEINSPLWSLQWEMIFSLALPVYVYGCTRARTRRAAVAASLMLLGVVAIGEVLTVGALRYLPLFALGALMAVHRPELAKLAARIGDRSTTWAALAVVVGLSLTLEWLLRGIPGLPVAVLGVGRLSAAVGACGAVFLALHSPGLRSFLSTGRMHWLGRRSFSLYLVHEPIVVALAFIIGWEKLGLLAVVAIPLSLAAAEAFYIAVERPSHRLARVVGLRAAPRPAAEVRGSA